MARAPSLDHLLQEAVGLHKAQQFVAAEKIYDRILGIDRINPDALNLKGMIAFQQGRLTDAVALFDRALAALPSFADAHVNRGNALTALGHNEDAISAYEQALALRPDNLGASGAISPLLAARGEFKKAAAHLRRVIDAAPLWTDQQRAEMMSNLGDYLRQDEQHDEAIKVHRQALALWPSERIIAFNLAVALQNAGMLSEAEQHYLGLTRTHPDFVRAFVNLAMVYRDQGRTDECITLLEETLLQHPNVYQSYANLGAAFSDKGWPITGMLLHAHAMSLKGTDSPTRLDGGCALLSIGQFENWDKYQYRFDVPLERNVARPTPPPVWQGENLAGKRVLIWTEQGIGDEILHASMIPDILARHVTYIIECSDRLVPIFARSFPQATVVERTAPHVAATPAQGLDWQIPLGNLGRHFRTSYDKFPRHQGYLKADPVKVAAIRRRYEQQAGGRRIVGVSWRSKSEFISANKSAQLINFAPILKSPDVLFVNLQYGDCTAELANVRKRLKIDIFEDPAIDPLKDMDSSFAQVAAMDLVVTTSNTTAHVAGSLGVPVWVVLPPLKGALWYWFIRRTDSPWYPSATLFRARRSITAASWDEEVMPRLADAFSQWAMRRLEAGKS